MLFVKVGCQRFEGLNVADTFEADKETRFSHHRGVGLVVADRFGRCCS